MRFAVLVRAFDFYSLTNTMLFTELLVLARRARGDKISIWIHSNATRDQIFAVGARILFALNLQARHDIQMDFSYHSDSMKSGSSYRHGGAQSSGKFAMESLRNALRKQEVKLIEA